jgi:hypothetical protein
MEANGLDSINVSNSDDDAVVVKNYKLGADRIELSGTEGVITLSDVTIEVGGKGPEILANSKVSAIVNGTAPIKWEIYSLAKL